MLVLAAVLSRDVYEGGREPVVHAAMSDVDSDEDLMRGYGGSF